MRIAASNTDRSSHYLYVVGRLSRGVSPEQAAREILEANRAKLETGLTYHARHILVLPDAGVADATWENARIAILTDLHELIERDQAWRESIIYTEQAQTNARKAFLMFGNLSRVRERGQRADPARGTAGAHRVRS